MRVLVSAAIVSLLLVMVPASAGRSSGKLKDLGTAIAVPHGFVGVDADGPLFAPQDHVNLSHQFDVMVASGVDSVRVAFSWADAQPYRDWADVPAGRRSDFVDVSGVPTNFSATDQIVRLAAQRGMTVLPIVIYSPGWDAGKSRNGLSAPARTAPYAAFLTALIDRYGPHGGFWAGHGGPRVPIRMWQIWNEPNIAYYWPQPFARSYAALLKAAHDAIKRADPGAKVVLGALTNFAWTALGTLQKIRGVGRLFDVISVNGFTATPSLVILYLRIMRRAVNGLGLKAKPILATELSWTSAKGKTAQQYTWDTTEAGQARNISKVLPMLAGARTSLGLAGFYYYTWAGQERRGAPSFDFAGLFRVRNGRVVAKPAYAAFRRAALALERCRVRARTAPRCAKRG